MSKKHVVEKFLFYCDNCGQGNEMSSDKLPPSWAKLSLLSKWDGVTRHFELCETCGRSFLECTIANEFYRA